MSRLLDEVPAGIDVSGARVVPILNGLGTVKYEELFVVYRRVDRLLRAAGVEVVEPEVGEFCTSFDMAGCSLTLLWLDDELERLWTAPADTPAFRRGSVAQRERVEADTAQAAQRTIPPASAESREAATVVAGLLARTAEAIAEHADELGRMDSVAGDGDHGIGMQRGSRAGASAARSAAADGAGAGTTLDRGRRRLVRPGRRHVRGDLGTDPADPRPGARRRRTGGRGGGVGAPSSRPRTS